VAHLRVFTIPPPFVRSLVRPTIIIPKCMTTGVGCARTHCIIATFATNVACTEVLIGQVWRKHAPPLRKQLLRLLKRISVNHLQMRKVKSCPFLWRANTGRALTWCLVACRSILFMCVKDARVTLVLQDAVDHIICPAHKLMGTSFRDRGRWMFSSIQSRSSHPCHLFLL